MKSCFKRGATRFHHRYLRARCPFPLPPALGCSQKPCFVESPEDLGIVHLGTRRAGKFDLTIEDGMRNSFGRRGVLLSAYPASSSPPSVITSRHAARKLSP